MKRAIFFSLLITAIAGSLVVGLGFPRAQERKVDDVLGQQTNQNGGNNDDDDEKIPEAWRGTWKVTVAYRDHATGALVATDVTTAAICPGEPIIPDLAIKSLDCAATAKVNEIGALCSAKHSPLPGCNVFVNTVLDSKRQGNTWSGTGSWSAKVVGSCEHMSFGEDLVVSGKRVSSEAACFGVRSSLVQRFFPHPKFIRFLTEGNSHDEK
jgi:hypothetical protein